MNKIWIILKSEFMRRVRTKMFVITTLLAPILLIAIGTVPGIVGYFAAAGDEDERIAVVDETGVLLDRLRARGAFRSFVEAELPVDSLQQQVRAGELHGYLVFPDSLIRGAGSAYYYSAEGGGFSMGFRLSDAVDEAVQDYRLEAAGASTEVRGILDDDVSVEMLTLTEEGTKADSTFIYSIVGYIMGFIIYGALFAYGGIVMQSVIEEKTSRVVEVVVSAVRPFQLLMGKVLGIGAMGLLQFIFWGLLIGGALTFAGSAIALFLDPSELNLPEGASQDALLQAADITIPTIEPAIFIGFVLFFLGGYLLYASLFAAVGSAVEQQQDAQSLMMPITLLIIMPMLFITVLVEDPNSTLAVVLSIIPFFSPILMIVRMSATEVPFWQLALSYLLLYGSFVGTIWVSSRIYRVGILMYGKKPTLREMVRWFSYG